jgi:hypothetical protein
MVERRPGSLEETWTPQKPPLTIESPHQFNRAAYSFCLQKAIVLAIETPRREFRTVKHDRPTANEWNTLQRSWGDDTMTEGEKYVFNQAFSGVGGEEPLPDAPARGRM